MTWFKVDDSLAFNAKIVAAGTSLTLWTRAGAWSAQQLSDGFVPDHMARLLGSASMAAKLIEVGLWHRGDGGYIFHDWTDYQPSREDVEADRRSARQRMASLRAGRNGEREKPPDDGFVRPNETGTTPARSGSVRDPVPSRPEVPFGTSSASATSPPTTPRPRRKPELPLPDDWTPTSEHHGYAAAHGLDLDHEAAMFRAHADANDRLMRSWNGAFTTWLGRAKPRPKNLPEGFGNPSGRRRGPENAEENAASMLASVQRLEDAQRNGRPTELFGAIGSRRGTA